MKTSAGSGKRQLQFQQVLIYFDRIIESGSCYVDKTDLIRGPVSHEDITVSLFTRPRRFVKTLTMTMSDCFFNVTRDSKEIFSELKISE